LLEWNPWNQPTSLLIDDALNFPDAATFSVGNIPMLTVQISAAFYVAYRARSGLSTGSAWAHCAMRASEKLPNTSTA
jgi:hypothetical protein